MPCIDIHHHFFPPDLQRAKAQANMDLGWKTPPGNLQWSPELSLKAMDEIGIDVSILSYPAMPQGPIGDGNRQSARNRNEFISRVCQNHPRFGFFASLPVLDDTEGCLSEIAYSFDKLDADGISLSSSYGEGQAAKYIGDEAYNPIWRELDQRKAVVFLHGLQTPSSTPYPHPYLGVPITEVPNETFKAAAHLVVTGRKRQYPNVKIILAHMGGTLVSMAARTAVLSNYMGCTLSPEEILEDFRTFYFDTALAAYSPTLSLMERFAQPGRLLLGTDFPAVNTETVSWFNNWLKEHFITQGNKLQAVLYQNALTLFPNKTASLEKASLEQSQLFSLV